MMRSHAKVRSSAAWEYHEQHTWDVFRISCARCYMHAKQCGHERHTTTQHPPQTTSTQAALL